MSLADRLSPWGQFRFIRELEGGSRNPVFLLAQDERLWVAKATSRSESALGWLDPVQRAAEVAGFVVPRFVRTAHHTWSENGLTLEPFIEGEVPSSAALPSLAPLIRRMHAETATVTGQRPGFASAIDLLEQSHIGDIDLSSMPEPLVERCRELWLQVAGLPRAAIHADLHSGNILHTPDGRYALLDWDEARLDATVFDTWALVGAPGPEEQLILNAWEVAVSWHTEPGYAHRLATGIMGLEHTGSPGPKSLG